MNSKRPSLKDIAQKLNVSVTTVSFVLNGKGKEKKISDEVISKIKNYVKEINYRPNLVAQSLRTGKTKILVFMVEDIGNYFFAKLTRIIEDIAYKKGYKVLFCSTENDDARSKELINMFYERQVDGFIIIPSPGIKEDIEALIQNKVPVVLFDRYFEALNTPYVGIDNYKSAYNATQHLINNGFKNIAFITTDIDQTQMLGRLEGYNDAVIKHKLPNQIFKVPYNEINKNKGKEYIRSIFKDLNDTIDAVFFSTNYLTQTALEVLKETSSNRIDTLGIVTFDDSDLFKIYSPSITAIAQPLEELGTHLMNITLDLIDTPFNKNKNYNVILDTKLVVRESSLKQQLSSKL